MIRSHPSLGVEPSHFPLPVSRLKAMASEGFRHLSGISEYFTVWPKQLLVFPDILHPSNSHSPWERIGRPCHKCHSSLSRTEVWELCEVSTDDLPKVSVTPETSPGAEPLQPPLAQHRPLKQEPHG